MNDKTRIMFNLARMHEYANDIIDICNNAGNDYSKVVDDKVTRYAVSMCLVQLGEHSARIRDIDQEYYEKNPNVQLLQIKHLRDRVVHSYGNIDYTIIKNILSKDVPELKDYLEKSIIKEVLSNPYVLYDKEYEEFDQEPVN